MATWKEVEEKYGKELADKMIKCPYLIGITMTVTPEGVFDIPESDIYVAWKWATGKSIHVFEID